MATPQPVRVSVGRQRIHLGIREARPSEASYARNIGAQMRAIRDNLKKIIADIEDVTPQALIHGLQPIFDESQHLVPVLTGRLKGSGFLRVEKTAIGAAAAIGYAKGGIPFYAAFVHERIWVFHKPPTQAKYLEEAVNRHINEVGSRVTSYIKAQTGLIE